MAAKRTLILLVLTVFTALAANDEVPLNAVIEPEFIDALRADPMLLHYGGAKVVETHNKRYFIAVGVTSAGSDSPQEKLRQIRVGRLQAIKASAEFIQETKVKAQEKFTEESTVSHVDEKKNGTSTKVFEESTLTQIEAVLKVPPQIGSWKSSDGGLFFYAIGTELHQ